MSAPASPALSPADRERLDRILEADELATADVGPTVRGWLEDVIGRAFEDLLVAAFPGVASSAGLIAVGVLVITAILAVVIGVRIVYILRGRAAPNPGAVVAAPLAAPLAPPSRGEIERQLAAGDPSAALRALWRWVAAHVEAHGFARPAPDRTNRELLAEVRRAAPGWDRLPALARLTNQVDGLLYGGVPLDVANVRELLPLAEQVVL